MTQRYDTYKNSGVQWLGEIPGHWNTIPMNKAVYEIRTGLNPRIHFMLNTDDADGYYITIRELRGFDIITDNSTDRINNQAVRRINERARLKAGDVLISGTATIGRTALVTNTPIDWGIKEGIYAITPKIDFVGSRYLIYYLNSDSAIFFMDAAATGSTVRSVSMAKLYQMPIPLPPIPEQQAIVSYLDTKCSQLDKMLEGKQKQIDLLSEMKQRVIADAVTHGLNPDVKMKATNIPWLPEIPEHWECKRGKFLFNTINDISTTGQEELLTVSDRTGITPRSMKNVTMFMSESLVGYKKCKVGDICSNIMWMWHGAIGVTKYDGVISPSYVVYRQRNKYFLDEYLDKLLRLPQLVKWYSALSKGLTESRLRLYPDSFLNILFYVPPISEQQAIVSYIQERITKIDLLASKLQQEIENIKEYKQRLISDVVTGQIKVC